VPSISIIAKEARRPLYTGGMSELVIEPARIMDDLIHPVMVKFFLILEYPT
jgi:hypothetical protein